MEFSWLPSNIRSTSAEGALTKLTKIVDEFNKNILAIQETKHKGNSIIEIVEYIFFNSG